MKVASLPRRAAASAINGVVGLVIGIPVATLHAKFAVKPERFAPRIASRVRREMAGTDFT